MWGSCLDNRLLTLQKLQNRAARIVANSSFDAPADALIEKLSWPTIADIIKQETSTMVSGLIISGENLEDTRNKTSCILKDMCQEEHIMFLEYDIIDAQQYLNSTTLQSNKYRDSILANNFLALLCV